MAAHVTQDAIDDLLQVGFALAQVGVVHFIELARHLLQLRNQRPFGVVAPLDNPLVNAVAEHFVLQQHEVDVQQCGQFGRGVGGQLVGQALQLVRHRIARALGAGEFIGDLLGLDEVVAHLGAAARNHDGTPNGDAARNRQTMQGEGHAVYWPSPNLSWISATSAVMASASWGPSVSSTTWLPKPAASIITPMILLALMRRSPLLIQTSQRKLPASLVSLAEARACRPSLLVMVISCFSIGIGIWVGTWMGNLE